MPRMLDLTCAKCNEEVDDFYVQHVPQRIIHLFSTNGSYCGGKLEQVYRLRSRNAQWSDRDAVVVFRKPDGTISYPGRNDASTPAGHERVVMRSLREVERFERDHNVIAHVAHFDTGSGRSADDTPPAPSTPSQDRSEAARFARFREYTRGIL